MTIIHTLQGSVDSKDLGLALLHEHVIWQYDDSRRKATIDFTVKMLEDASHAGIKTVIDLTPHRRIDWLMEVSAQVDINIVTCSGYYRQPLVPKILASQNEEQMVDRMVREFTVGIDTLPARAGIIKVAADNPELTPWEMQVFTAAAKAHLRTGACIATHAVAGARSQADVLLRGGANLSQVFFSHVDTEVGWEGRNVQEDAQYLVDIARQGGYLLFNNFGCEFYTTHANEIELMKRICDAGFQEKLLISIDCNWTWNQEGKIEFEEEANHPEAGLRTYAFMMTDTVPDLLKSGFTEQDIHTFLVDNPYQFFSQSNK